MAKNVQVIEDYDATEGGQLDIVAGGGDIDIQIATAKRYPRSVQNAIDTCLTLVTQDEGTAESCLYALPRDGKVIEGPSARFAEMLAYSWGNVRVGAKIIREDKTHITAQGIAWDVENNVIRSTEIKRRITNREGRRYSDDMIVVTGNAACSIASRNAVLATIPKALWERIYRAARATSVGDVQTIQRRREAMLSHFMHIGVPNERVFEVLSVKGVEDIGVEELATMKGIASAIKSGEASVESLLDREAGRTEAKERAKATTEKIAARGKGKEAPERASGTEESKGGMDAPPAPGAEPESEPELTFDEIDANADRLARLLAGKHPDLDPDSAVETLVKHAIKKKRTSDELGVAGMNTADVWAWLEAQVVAGEVKP